MYHLETKSVQELRGLNFLIPSYQRGYRWTDQEVNKLLGDLYDFNPGVNQDKYYCLQPLVVYDDEELKRWEVIDGQQRLTTIFLLLKVLFNNDCMFQIAYETRIGSSDYLNEIETYLSNDSDNIDFHHMKNAYVTIQKWLNSKMAKELDAKSKLTITLNKHVRFIWYEISDNLENRMEVFNRLNVGKIPLTDGELVKALFLRKENYPIYSEDRAIEEINKQRRSQKIDEIARQWDDIEKQLSDPELWAFINGKDPDIPNRIGLVLRIYAESCGCKLGHEHAVFDFYEEKLKNSIAECQLDDSRDILEKWPVIALWSEVQENFLKLKEWFKNPELYHLAAYAIANTKLKPIDLLKRASGSRKSEFARDLKNLIWNDLGVREFSDILSLRYDEDNANLMKVLLLFNIQEALSRVGERLSFHCINNTQWSLEHILAQNSEDLTDKNQWIEWMLAHRDALVALEYDSSQAEECRRLVSLLDATIHAADLRKNNFNKVFDEVVVFYKQNNMGLDIHDLGNMALLDRDSNSALNNYMFDVKNRIIKQRIYEGQYILPGTWNVFQKYYSVHAGSLHYWSEQDAIGYRAKVLEGITKLFGGEPL